MQVGVVFPQNEIGGDGAVVRAYATTVAELGFQHFVAYDHILGVDPVHHPGWRGWYDVDSTFHEPLVLFGFLAALTSMELVSGVLVLPQRQTELVAKQAAEVDLLSAGRFRLGVGIGWNSVEHHALGMDFHTRGVRMQEQIARLRDLWTTRSISVRGHNGSRCRVGIAPLPTQRPIPVWIGAGSSNTGLRRVGALADGWFPLSEPGPQLRRDVRVVRDAALHAGRNPGDIGMEGLIDFKACGLEGLAECQAAWRAAGATHVSIDTMRAGIPDIDAHLSVLAAAAPIMLAQRPPSAPPPLR